MTNNQLLAGASVADITPPLEVGLLTSSVNGSYEPFESVRLPLNARVLVLKSVVETIAIVSLDLLALNDTSVGGWEKFKNGLSGIISPEHIIITCTHTHNAPESVALSRLYLTPVYREWLSAVQLNIKEAIQKAANTAKECRLFFKSSVLEGYSMQRRIQTADGIIMSDSIQPISNEILNREPVDRRVKAIRFEDTRGNAIATLVHAICHTVHEMCMRHISAEFPGEMCLALEASGKNGMAMFLNGAAGDTNPPTVSMGAGYARHHGIALAAIAGKNDNWLPVNVNSFGSAHSEKKFLVRREVDIPNRNDAMARLSAIRLGSLAILFLPGEPFVETALEIERDSPFEQTIIAAYSENNIGYIPTVNAFREGGYEVGPGKWSFLEIGADKLLHDWAVQLLRELYNK